MATANAGAGAPGLGASHPYTCNTCQVAYRNSELQKGHMKSDWHRYNLKRRVASLPPIPSKVFTEKVLQARAATTADADKAYFERTCEACNKTYYSDNAYRNHVLSQKHKQKLSAAAAAAAPQRDDEITSLVSSTFSLGEPTAVARDQVDSDAEDEFNQVIESLQKATVTQQRPSPVKRPSNHQPVGPDAGTNDANDGESATTGPEPTWTLNSCLFCNYDSPSVPLNVRHMERFHGMFIPEKPYLADLEGLMTHLQRKVGQDHECLSCGKVKSTVFAAQTHMRDKGHCNIPYTSEEQQLRIGDFYDFRSTYSDGEEDGSGSGSAEREPGGAKLVPMEDEGGWETDSSASSLDSADLAVVPAEGHIHQFERLSKHPHHSHKDPRHHHHADGWHSRAHKHAHAVFYDDYELHLPSGKSVGHRSLNRYYQQNLYNHPVLEERKARLAIEAAGSEASGSEASGSESMQLAACDGGRQVLPRGALGMAGVLEDKKRQALKAQRRDRDKQKVRAMETDLAYGTRANVKKNYYYRYNGGG